MPPWKLRTIRDQSRGWSDGGIARAIRAVARADADIKGAASDASYTLERLVLTVTRAARGALRLTRLGLSPPAALAGGGASPGSDDGVVVGCGRRGGRLGGRDVGRRGGRRSARRSAWADGVACSDGGCRGVPGGRRRRLVAGRDVLARSDRVVGVAPTMRPIVGPSPWLPPVIDETLSPTSSSNAVIATTAAAKSPAAARAIRFQGSTARRPRQPGGPARRRACPGRPWPVQGRLGVREVGVDPAAVARGPAGPAHLGLGHPDLAEGRGLRLEQPLAAARQALAVERPADRHDHAAERGADDGAGRTEGGEQDGGGDRRQRSTDGPEPVDLELRGCHPSSGSSMPSGSGRATGV